MENWGKHKIQSYSLNQNGNMSESVWKCPEIVLLALNDV